MAASTKRAGVLTALAAALLTCTAALADPQAEKEAERLRREKVKQLTAQAKAYIKDGKYDLALKTAKEAARIAPDGIDRGFMWQVRAWHTIGTSREKLRQYPAPAIERMIADLEKRPTHAGLFAVKHRLEQWIALNEAKKEPAPLRDAPDPEAQKRIREQLRMPVSVEFPGTGFDTVIDFLHDLTGLNFDVDPAAKRRQNIGPDTTIKLKLTNVRVESALKAVLDQVGLKHKIKRDGRILITDAKGLAAPEYELRVYDVRDLLFAMAGPADEDDERKGADTREHCGDNAERKRDGERVSGHVGNLVRLIRNAVAPDSWSKADTDFDGDKPSIQTYRNEMLIVKHTPKVHEQIWYLLVWLRAYLRPGDPPEGRRDTTPVRLGINTPAMKRVREQLATPVTIEFDGTKFDDVIGFLVDLTSITIIVDQEAMVRQGIHPDTRVTLRLSKVQLSEALPRILSLVNLGYAITRTCILVTDAEGLPYAEVIAYRIKPPARTPKPSKPPAD